MDVSLILTHRCNLDCHYCYAGAHHRTDIDERVLQRGVDLLFADGSKQARLSFFGGEPFLAFDAMQRAVALAETRAQEHDATLVLQCTTNGTRIGEAQLRFILAHEVRITVSIDGIREAHEANRPSAGGKSSYESVRGGLRALIAAGAPVDAMMVLTPETAKHAYLSASSLWGEGVSTVRANLALEATWTEAERAELREQLVSIGWEQLARQLRGETPVFQPFSAGMRQTAGSSPRSSAARTKVVVGTSGHLYPCPPMVGEDRDEGPEAELRIGHVDQSFETIQRAAATDGVRCEDGKGCQCASYLETGSRYTPGQMGRWYGLVCAEIGRTIAQSLDKQGPAPVTAPRRRRILWGLAAVVGSAAVGAPLLFGLLGEDDDPRPCRIGTRRSGPEEFPPPGQLAMPEPVVDGELMMPEPPPEPPPDGELMMPEPPPDGDLAEPSDSAPRRD